MGIRNSESYYWTAEHTIPVHPAVADMVHHCPVGQLMDNVLYPVSLTGAAIKALRTLITKP
jgi:hypothetical protein